MASVGATPRRRKIFPHLKDEGKKSEASGSADDTNNNNDNDAKSKPANDEASSYDNAKSKGSKKKSAKSSSSNNNASSGNGNTKNDTSHDKNTASASSAGIHHHLLPLPLVLTVLVCSGLFWIASFRDVMATGKPILDTLGFLWGQDDADANFLQYTKSTQWYTNSGWKSTQGGLSTIKTATTDANNMGGLFLRKFSGVAGLAFHTSKIWPIVFHSPPHYDSSSPRWVGASWSAGHFDPILTVGMIGNVCVGMFYLGRLEELKNAGARGIGMAFVLTSLVEAFIFGLYLLSRRMNHKVPKIKAAAKASTAGRVETAAERYKEDPNSLPSRIVARTVMIVSSLILVLSLRDLFFPGSILPFIPRDDIYLEWTGAFLHSPPPDTVEADEHGLEAPLFAGDKFIAQQLAMYLSLGCMFKMLSAWGWSKGNRIMGRGMENVDRSGVVSSKMIWKAQALGDMMMLGMLRMFTPAAKSASLDLRWHLMLVAYEMLILFLYAFL